MRVDFSTPAEATIITTFSCWFVYAPFRKATSSSRPKKSLPAAVARQQGRRDRLIYEKPNQPITKYPINKTSAATANRTTCRLNLRTRISSGRPQLISPSLTEIRLTVLSFSGDSTHGFYLTATHHASDKELTGNVLLQLKCPL